MKHSFRGMTGFLLEKGNNFKSVCVESKLRSSQLFVVCSNVVTVAPAQKITEGSGVEMEEGIKSQIWLHEPLLVATYHAGTVATGHH